MNCTKCDDPLNMATARAFSHLKRGENGWLTVDSGHLCEDCYEEFKLWLNNPED